jgi:hypothetical protein
MTMIAALIRILKVVGSMVALLARIVGGKGCGGKARVS